MIKKENFFCPHYHNAWEHPNCWNKYGDVSNISTVYFDIETNGLQADFNNLLTYSFKVANKNEYITGTIKKSELRYQGDKRLVEEICHVLHTFDRVVTYYGSRFDLPFIRTKALEYGIDFPSNREVQQIDLWQTARRKLKLHSNRLISVCDILGIKGKSSVQPVLWRKANFGDLNALNAILKHNMNDVMVLEKVHKRLEEHVGYTRSSI